MLKTTVSVVIPARDSKDTIRRTIESLYNQTRKPNEVIIVIGENDITHTAIEDFINSGFVKIVTTKPSSEYVRDAQWKRWVGVKASVGEIIFLTDSKVVVEKEALEKAISLMNEYQVSVVGGITPGWEEQKHSFWCSLHDNALVSNLPKFPEAGVLGRENFGQTESLPVTSNLMFTREVFEKVKDDFALEFSKVASTYDDYLLSWLIVQAGYQILITNQVIAHHKHRISWSGYSKQIARSGQSAAVMARMYPECPFGARRLNQVIIISLALMLAVAVGIFLAISGRWLMIMVGLALSFGGYVVLGVINVIKTKEYRAFIFPWFTILLILNFAFHFNKIYVKKNYTSSSVNKYLQIH
ncbi:MAG: glycosyltransferase [Candidatus Hodarchaeales archaeon]